MADVAAPSVAVADAGVTDKKKPAAAVKPAEPDEAAYQAALKKAEKEHADSQTKFVSISASASSFMPPPGYAHSLSQRQRADATNHC